MKDGIQRGESSGRVGVLPAIALSLLLLPLLPACGEEATPAAGVPECSDDAPCQGRVRVCEGGKCVRSTHCETDADCPETDADGDPLLCENGICLEYCQGYMWCPQPYYICELETHMCVRRDVSGVCETHEDCDPQFTCGPHLQPDGTKVCQPGDRCSSEAGCADSDFGPVCFETSCVECADGEGCPESSMVCENYECLSEPPKQCVHDIECCPPDMECSKTCVEERCREAISCEHDVDCFVERGRYCYQGTCSPPCTNPRAICMAGHECLEGARCGVAVCTSDEECGGDRRCVGGECKQPTPDVFECQDDADCPNVAHGGTCRGGVCWEPQRCSEQGEPDTCLGTDRVCDYDPFIGADYIHCQDLCQARLEPACPEGTFCDVDGLCSQPPEVSGCMTSEMCADGQRCDRQLPAPTCVDEGAGACRSDRGCREDEFCVDDHCAGVLPVVCSAEAPCPGQQICNLQGACELAGACAGDVDCNGGLRCDVEAGRCDGCAGDGDCGMGDTSLRCGEAPSGRYLLCVEDPNGFCAENGDCVAGRLCEDGFCTPKPCQDDWMHRAPPPAAGDRTARGNHSPMHAAPIGARTFVELRLCDGFDDWFSIDLQQDEDLQATIVWATPVDGLADLSLELWKDNVMLASSDGIGGSERVGINGAPADGTYLLHVGGNAGVAATYQLRAEVGDVCVDDAHEGAAGNNAMPDAQPIQPGLLRDLVLCTGQSGGSPSDWYLVDTEPGSAVDVRVEWEPADGVLEATLFDSEPAPVGVSEAGDGWFSFHLDGWGAEDLFLMVRANDENLEPLRYSVRLQAALSDETKRAICEGLPDLPLDWDDIEPGEAFPTRARAVVEGDLEHDFGLANAWIGTCDPEVEGHVAAEKAWRLDTTTPAFQGLPVDLTFLYQSNDLDFRSIVYLRGDCVDDGREIVCLETPLRAFSANTLPTGVYYVVVDARGDSTGSFELTVQLALNTQVEPNPCDSCLNACVFPAWEPGGVHLETTRVEGYSDDGEPNVEGSCIDRRGAVFGPDVGYAFVTEEPCRFAARLSTDDFLGGLVLRDECPAANELGCSYSGELGSQMLFDPELPAGTYSLWVKGGDALQAGDFSLDLSCSEPGVAPPGDVCNDPVPIVMEPLESNRGDVIGATGGIVGDNVGASDVLHLGRACNDGGAPVGGDKVHTFSFERQATLFVSLESDFDAVVSISRSCWGAEDNALACGTVGEEIQLPDLEPAEYFLVVDGADVDQIGTYEVSLTAIDTGNIEAPPNDSCDEPEEFVFQIGARVQREGHTAGGLDDAAPALCAGGDAAAADVVYGYVADTPHVLWARTMGADFDTVLYVRRMDCENGPEVACGQHVIEDVELDAGDYFLFVDGVGDEEDVGSFTLEVEWRPPVGECGDNESCADPIEIGIVDGRGTAVGSTAPCGADEDPLSCGVPGEEGRDVVYRLELEERSIVRLTLDTEEDLVLHVREEWCQRAREVYCDSSAPVDILTDELAAGTYYVIVDTEFGDSPGGAFSLFVDVQPLGPSSRNDTCGMVDGAAPDPQHPGDNGRIVLDELGHALVSGRTDNAAPDYENRPPGAGYVDGCPDVPGRDTAAASDVVYRLDLEVESTVEAIVRPGTLALPVLYLRSANCENPAAEVACVDGAASLRMDSLAPGAWYFVVDGHSDAFGAGTFDLEVNVLPVGQPADNDDCATAVALALEVDEGDPRTASGMRHGTTLGAADDYRPVQCADGDQAGQDVVYRLDLPFDENDVVVDVTAHDSPDLQRPADLVLYLRDGVPSCEEGAEVEGGCNDNRLGVDPGIRLDAAGGRNLSGGTYFLFVDGAREAEVGGFTVEVQVEEVREARPPDNDTCELVDAAAPDPGNPGVNGRVIPDAEGHAAIAGTTDNAGADYENRPPGGGYEAGCAAEVGRDTAAAPDVVYRLDLAEESSLEARVVPGSMFRPILSLRGPGSCGEQAAEVACVEAGVTLSQERLPAGSWYLLVDGYDGDFPTGTFQVVLDVAPVAEVPANDACDGGGVPVLEFFADDPPTTTFHYDGETTLAADDDAPRACVPAQAGGADVVHLLRLDADYTVELTFIPEGWNGQLYLRETCDDGASEVACDQEVVGPVALSAGDYYLWVDGDGPIDRGPYRLLVHREPTLRPPCNESCAIAVADAQCEDGHGPTPLDLGDGSGVLVEGAIHARTEDDGSGTCGGIGGGDAVYEIQVEEPGAVLAASFRFRDFQPHVYLRGACDDQGSEIACADDGFVTDLLAAGTYYLWVDAQDAQEEGTYELDVMRFDPPANDTCDAAIDVGLRGDGLVSVEGSTLAAAHDYEGEGCGGADGSDVVYSLRLPTSSTVWLTLDADFDAVLHVTQGACDPDAPAAVAAGCAEHGRVRLSQVEADTTYWLHVDGAGAADAGTFRLAVEADSVECVEDAQCPGTRRCVEGHCPEAAPCFAPADCDPGRECVEFWCVGVCDDDDDCPASQVCDVEEGICAEPERCGDDADCLRGRICQGRRCREPCLEDDDCGGAQTCDVGSGRCAEADACTLDEDCLGWRVCEHAACLLPDCEVNGDCAGACVDRLCADGPPVACEDDEGCPGEQVCAPLGVCLLDGPCGQDDECPAGLPVCAGGRCVACTADAGCAAAELCEHGGCEYAGGCAGDEDCPGDRTCEQGDCVVSPGCEDDAFDLDPEPPGLLPRTYTGLVLCDDDDDDEDVYAAEVPAGEGLLVVLRHAAGDGDLSLAVRDAVQRFDVLARSDGRVGVERVALSGGLQPRAVEVVVRGRLGFSVPYALTLEHHAADACLPDDFEGLLGNDSGARAAHVGAGDHAAVLCPGDEDWFALALRAGTHLTVQATLGVPDVQVGLSLVAPDGAVLAAVEDDGDTVEVSADAAAPGRYLVRVWSADPQARVPFQLGVSAGPAAAAEALACREVAELGAWRWFTFPESVPVRRFDVSCGDGFSTDYVAQFELLGPSVVTLQAVGAAAVALRDDCDDPGSERTCGSGLDPGFEDLALGAGTWTVVVQPFDILPPRLLLEPRQRCEADGDCGEGSVCDGLLCHPDCAVDDDCPGAQTCEGGTGHCLEPGVCVASEDCLGVRECRYDGECFLPECEDNEDCGGACVDRSCALGPPVACEDNGDCDAPQVCAPVGACALDQECAGDNDCPGGSRFCVAVEGRCFGCVSDADCAPAEACGGGRCRYVGPCDVDADCPGDRVCNDLGACVPGEGCEGDRLDETPGVQIRRRTYGGLVLCDGTADVYSHPLAAGEGLRAVLRHSQADGDLLLALEDATPPLRELARSDQQHGVEVVGVEPLGQARDLNVVVRGRPGADVPYSLTLERPEAGACPPDELEGPFGNDEADHAAWIGVEEWEHVLCPGEEDWFALDLRAGSHVTVRTTFEVPGASVALTLQAPDGQPLAEGAAGDGSLVAAATIEAPGRHLVRVRAPQPGPRLPLGLVVTADAAGDAEALACAHPQPLVPGEPTLLPQAPPVSRFAFSCVLIMPGLNADHLLSFHLDDPAVVTLEVLGGAEAAAIRSACAAPDSEVACGMAGDPALEGVALGAGDWWVVVEGLAGQRPEVLLTVE